MYARAALVFSLKIHAALFLCLLLGCAPQPQPRKIDRSFYYWKSVFRLTPSDQHLLDSLQVHTLYTKFFDVAWNSDKGEPLPVASIRFETPLPRGINIVPVVFITNETLEQMRPDQTAMLAQHIAEMVSLLAKGMTAGELQIDCDWSQSTKEKYFQLLRQLREQPYAKGKLLSATIRLHQLKYRALTGVPPVDKGLLMCYNMGNLRHPETKNSILDVDEMERYTGSLANYPLPMDVALPVFDWFVWFHNNGYRGLVHTFQLPALAKQNMVFENDTTINDLNFQHGDRLRYEGSDPGEVLRAAHSINKKLKGQELHVILYHLDQDNLRNYSLYQLDALYNGLR
jgi:hypothetical protein